MSVLACYFYAVSWASVTRVLAPRWCVGLLWAKSYPEYDGQERDLSDMRVCLKGIGFAAYFGHLLYYTRTREGGESEFGVTSAIWLLVGASVLLSGWRLHWHRRRPQSTIKVCPWNEETFAWNLWLLFPVAMAGVLPRLV